MGAATASAAGGVFIATAVELGAPLVPTAACLLVCFMALGVSIHLAMTAIRGTA